MDTASVAIPIPVQPIEPPRPDQGADGDTDADGGITGFAAALVAEIARTAIKDSGGVPLVAAPAATEDESAQTGAAADGLPIPDALIAMMAAPLATPAAAPAEAPPAAVAAAGARPQAEGRIAIARPELGEQSAAAAGFQPEQAFAMPETPPAPHPVAPETGLPVLPQLGEAPAAAAPVPAPLPAAPALHSVAPAAAHAEPQVAARVGSPEWGDGLARQVSVMVKDGEHTAQLRLDPPELGPLEVRLTMAREQDGVAHAQFVSPHAAVRDALEAALPQLRAVLAESGITLGQASVGEGYARDDAREAQQSGRGGASERHDEHDHAGIAAPRGYVRHGLVDTFA